MKLTRSSRKHSSKHAREVIPGSNFSPLVATRKHAPLFREDRVVKSSPLQTLRKHVSGFSKRRSEEKLPKTMKQTPVVVNPLMSPRLLESVADIATPPSTPSNNSWDLFVSDASFGSDEVGTVLISALRLRYGLRVWNYNCPVKDDHGEPDVASGSVVGIKKSKVFVIVASDSVFKDPCSQMEMRWCIENGKPIVVVFHQHKEKSFDEQVNHWIRKSPKQVYGYEFRSLLRSEARWVPLQDITGSLFEESLHMLIQSCEVNCELSANERSGWRDESGSCSDLLSLAAPFQQHLLFENQEDSHFQPAMMHVEPQEQLGVGDAPSQLKQHSSTNCHVTINSLQVKHTRSNNSEVPTTTEPMLDSRHHQVMAINGIGDNTEYIAAFRKRLKDEEVVNFTFNSKSEDGHESLKDFVQYLSLQLARKVEGFQGYVEESVWDAIAMQFGSNSNLTLQDASMLWDPVKLFRVLVATPSRMVQKRCIDKPVSVIVLGSDHCCQRDRFEIICQVEWSRRCPDWLHLLYETNPLLPVPSSVEGMRVIRASQADEEKLLMNDVCVTDISVVQAGESKSDNALLSHSDVSNCYLCKQVSDVESKFWDIWYMKLCEE